MKNPVGRPSKIEGVNLSLVKHYTAEGYTDKQLAKIFSVTEQTINNWKKDYPEFLESLKSGKLLADSKVEASLFQRACGYSHPEVHITNYQGKITQTAVIKHYPPDPTAMIFWLKNRKPEEWREKQEFEHTLKDYLHPELQDITNESLKEILTTIKKKDE